MGKYEYCSEKNSNFKAPSAGRKTCGCQGDGITVRSKQTGDRAGYGCDTCIYTGNPVNDQRICVAAG